MADNLVENGDEKLCSLGVNRYIFGNAINAGSYGVVYQCLDKITQEIVAIKHEFHGLSESTKREISILASLPPHPSIVGLRDALVDNWQRVFVVMEYMESDLHKWMVQRRRKPLTLCELKMVMKKILEGVKFLHKNGVMHRDLKPANILINNNKGDVKICDFGLSRVESGQGVYSLGVGTRWYRAPEVIVGDGRYTSAIDMWSVGCIMAELVLGQVLLPGKSEIEQLHYIQHTVGKLHYILRLKIAAAVSFEGAPSLTAAGMDLLKRLLAFDPNQRITAADALNHTWFKEFYGLLSE